MNGLKSNKHKEKDKVSEFVSETFPHMKSDEIELYRKLNSDDDIKRMAIDMGMLDKDVDEIFGKTKRKRNE